MIFAGWALTAMAACSGGVQGPQPSVCSAPQGSSADAQNLASANTTFALSFFPAAAAASGGSTGNVVLSPYSVSAALTMTASGAAGETATQMQNVLHLSATGADVAPSYAALSCADAKAGGSSGNTLSIANALWAQKGEAFEADFEGTLEKGFDAPLQLADFAGDPASAATAINAWASSATQGQIPQLVGSNDVTTETRLVLANAIYFKGTWAEKFDASKTSPQPFTLADGSTSLVETMNGLMDVKASLSADLTLLEMPYQGGDVVMDFLMPTAAGGLATFEAGLTPASLAGALQQLGASAADIVYVPKFTQTTQVELKTVLEGMGMTDAFDPAKADFSKMDGAMDLSIGAVVQQARIEVDENGTTAAAATAVDICNCFAVTEPNTVHIDHPFVFLLRSTQTGSILFMGQVAQPAT